MLIKHAADFRSSEITEKKVYLNRRESLGATAATTAAVAAGVFGTEAFVHAATPAPHGRKLENVKKTPFGADERPNKWEDITTYNNYYEFGIDKDSIRTCGRDWRRSHPDRVGVRIGFDEPLAHLIEADADIFLMPSRFEPCGLNQMYSLRYGTVPVVRAVGGLADTVTDYAPGRKSATGFVFEPYTPAALLEALKRALALYPDRKKWQALQVTGMNQDHSWDRSAREYVKLYERALRRGNLV